MQPLQYKDVEDAEITSGDMDFERLPNLIYLQIIF